MAKLIQATTIAEAWLEAVEHLLGCKHGIDFNLVLEVTSPSAFPPSGLKVMSMIDDMVVASECDPMSTVAGTLFPSGLYRRSGFKGMCEDYKKKIYPKIKKNANNKWGTYFGRVTMRVDKDGKPINPLEDLIDKLKQQSRSKSPAKSHYEMGVVDTCDIAVFDPGRDRKMKISGPCLSHLSFKLVDADAVRLTGIYRSHYYLQRAFGNLLALAQLQACVAKESGLAVGPLTCISTYAKLDLDGGWTMADIRGLVAASRDALESAEAKQA